jgi:hypothetical protein
MWDRKRERPVSCFIASFLLGLFFDPENRGDMFLRNVAYFPNFKTLQLLFTVGAVKTSNPTAIDTKVNI